MINNEIDKTKLENAIKITFKTRNTVYSENHSVFNDEFYTNTDRLTQWNAFKRKAKIIDNLTFETVLKKIKLELKPIYKRIEKEP